VADQTVTKAHFYRHRTADGPETAGCTARAATASKVLMSNDFSEQHQGRSVVNDGSPGKVQQQMHRGQMLWSQHEENDSWLLD
jgi:hypothetical protein